MFPGFTAPQSARSGGSQAVVTDDDDDDDGGPDGDGQQDSPLQLLMFRSAGLELLRVALLQLHAHIRPPLSVGTAHFRSSRPKPAHEVHEVEPAGLLPTGSPESHTVDTESVSPGHSLRVKAGTILCSVSV